MIRGKGSSGSYFLSKPGLDKDGKFCWVKRAVIKVAEEEIGMPYAKTEGALRSKTGIPNGQNCLREVVAYDMFEDILPPTFYCRVDSSAFKGIKGVRRGDCSVQIFIPSAPEKHIKRDDGASEEDKADIDPHKADFSEMAMCDLLLWNADRNSGNVLFDTSGHPHPIDHGCILPGSCQSGGVFYWRRYMQDDLQFSSDQYDEIEGYDVEEKISETRERYPQLGRQIENTLRVAALFVKKLAARFFSIKDIATFEMDGSAITPNLGKFALYMAALLEGHEVGLIYSDDDLPIVGASALDSATDEIIEAVEYAKRCFEHLPPSSAFYDLQEGSYSKRLPIWIQVVQTVAAEFIFDKGKPPTLIERLRTKIKKTLEKFESIQALEKQIDECLAHKSVPKEQFEAIKRDALNYMPYANAKNFDDVIHYLATQVEGEIPACLDAFFANVDTMIASSSSE